MRRLAASVSEDTPRGKFYRGKALHVLGDAVGMELLRQLAESGCAPAMCLLGSSARGTGIAEERTWLQKAADLNDPDRMALGHLRAERCCETPAVSGAGQLTGMFAQTRQASSNVQRTIFWARVVLLAGNDYQAACDVAEAASRLSKGLAVGRGAIQLLFVAGRELEG